MVSPWGVGVPLAVSIAGGYVVWLALQARLARPARPVTQPGGQSVAVLLRRADAAVKALRAQTESPADPVLRAQVSDVDDQAAAVLVDLHRFAAQAGTLEASLRQIPIDRLRGELSAARTAVADAPAGPLREELKRSVQALTGQVGVHDRLDTARRTLVARIEAAVLGLEGLELRVAELIVMHDAAGDDGQSTARLAELTGDVDSMRAGLAEARELSGGLLNPSGAAPAPAPISTPAPVIPPPDPAPRPRPRWGVVAGVVGLVLAGTCAVSVLLPDLTGTSAGHDCAVQLAFLGKLSGDDSTDGQHELDAAKLAVEQDNAAHTDCKVVLQSYDTRTGTTGEAHTIADDARIVGVVGPTYTSEAEDALPVLGPAGVVSISPATSASSLTGHGWKTFHRTLPSDDEQAEAGVHYLRDTLKAKRIFVVGDDSTYGTDLSARAAGLLAAASAGQADITGEQHDFADLVHKIVASKADSVYFGGLGGSGGRFVKALRAAAPAVAVVGGDQLITQSFFDNAGDAAKAVYATCPCIATDQGVSTFRTQFVARFAEAPSWYAPEAYDATRILLAGLRAGRNTRAALLTWVDTYDGDGISRHLRFNADGGVASLKLNIWMYLSDGKVFRSERSVD